MIDSRREQEAALIEEAERKLAALDEAISYAQREHATYRYLSQRAIQQLLAGKIILTED